MTDKFLAPLWNNVKHALFFAGEMMSNIKDDSLDYFSSLRRAEFRDCPFLEVEDGMCFWLDGKCYIKGNENFIFVDCEYKPRWFPKSQIVKL